MPNDPTDADAVSLFEAARVLARGGDLDAKLQALSELSRSISGASASAVLLYDPEVGHLVTPDGLQTIDPFAADDALATAIRDRRPVPGEGASGRPEIQALVPAANHGFVPLVVEEESGPEIEGLLVLGHESPEIAPASMETVGALADLAGVAIRQVRLQNALVEQSAYRERLAHTDALTGLANRPTFEQMLELELARADRQNGPTTVCVFDVDGLEQLTAEQGAGAADAVLRQVAATLASEVRLVDTVARLAGGEFGVIAPGDGGRAVAERVHNAIASLDASTGATISVSIGIARGPDNGTSGSELLSSAREALQRSRAAGPGGIESSVPLTESAGGGFADGHGPSGDSPAS